MGSRRRHDSLLAMIAKITPNLPARSLFSRSTQGVQIFEEQTLPSNGNGCTKVLLGSTIYEIHLSFGTFRVRISTHITKFKDRPLSSTDLLRKKRQQEITASFVPACCLASVFEWTISRGYCPQMTFKSFNLRPGWSPIFKYSALGDIQRVRQLIEEGSASPNDVDEDGWTPLHVGYPCQTLILLLT